jgi:hypothetical protein
MRFYAERPLRLARQLLADALVVGWVALCVAVARASREVVLNLQAPGQGMVRAGDQMQQAFDDAAATASRVPLIGDDLARALEAGSQAGASLTASGQEQVATIQAMADGTAVSVVLVGALPVVLVWLLVRIRYARVARSAVIIRQHNSDLLALRALTHLPARQLLGTAPDPVTAWRIGDRDAVHRLADLELRSLGLWSPSERPPDPPRPAWPPEPPARLAP